MKKGKFNPKNMLKLRKQLGCTQSEIAGFLGCDIKTYRDYEKGKQVPGAALLLDMYNFYRGQDLPVSVDYILGVSDFTTPENDYIGKVTGLSDTAIECLRGWYQEKQKTSVLHQYSNDTDTLNTILEYYGNIRKENKKKGLINGFSLFHFIGNFFNAHNFKRVQQDLIRYGNGSHFNQIEVGDTITKKNTGTSEVIEHLCTPISRGSFRGEDTTKLDIYNTENESEQYYIELSDIYREHCKSQIINTLKKIGGIE